MPSITHSSGYIFWKKHSSWIHLSLEKIWNKLRHNMKDHSITGLVDPCIPLSKLTMIFNISPCASVDTQMDEKNLIYLLSNMAWSISCTITWTHHVLNTENLQESWNPPPMLLQSRGSRNQQKSGIIQLPSHTLWCRSWQISSWYITSNINS